LRFSPAYGGGKSKSNTHQISSATAIVLLHVTVSEVKTKILPYIIDLSVNLTERKLSKNASLKKWLCIKISLWVKIVEIPSFPPPMAGGEA
jgi:hypothetical protein